MFRQLLLAVVMSCLLATAFAAEGTFTYKPFEKWGDACIPGMMQSPINIDTTLTEPAPEDAGTVGFGTMGQLDEYTVYFTGHTLQVALTSFRKEATVTIPANDYTIGNSTTVMMGDPLVIEPLQMHFHTMSEHTIDGFNAPGELHVVTKVKDGESDYCDDYGPCLAVFGFMTVYKGEGSRTTNKGLRKIFKEMPTSGAGEEYGITYTNKFNLDELLPKTTDYYTYLGSLTTPGCDEIVTWHVFKDPIYISTTDIDAHQGLVAYTANSDCVYEVNGVCAPPREKTNHRNVQPYFGRTVYEVTSA